MVLEQLDIHMQKKKKKNLDPDLILSTKTNSKQIIEQHIKQVTIKFQKII